MTISQNIHWDLQILRASRRILRFHLKRGKKLMSVLDVSHFSKLFIRFCHAVCLVCLLGFRVSSVTLAVTVTENTRRMFNRELLIDPTVRGMQDYKLYQTFSNRI